MILSDVSLLIQRNSDALYIRVVNDYKPITLLISSLTLDWMSELFAMNTMENLMELAVVSVPAAKKFLAMGRSASGSMSSPDTCL